MSYIPTPQLKALFSSELEISGYYHQWTGIPKLGGSRIHFLSYDKRQVTKGDGIEKRDSSETLTTSQSQIPNIPSIGKLASLPCPPLLPEKAESWLQICLWQQLGALTLKEDVHSERLKYQV